MNYQIAVITPPIAEPITLTEAKLHLRVDTTDDDTLIQSLIVASREYCEKYCNRRFMLQTLALSIDSFYDWINVDNSAPIPWYQFIELPYPPTSNIISITYIDMSGNVETLDPSIYTPDYLHEPARIYHAYNQSFPLVRQVPNAVVIIFTCGYASAVQVPESIKCAMKLLIGTWYDQRASVSETQMYKVPQSCESLLSMYRVMDI